jgi:hypothetical protein
LPESRLPSSHLTASHLPESDLPASHLPESQLQANVIRAIVIQANVMQGNHIYIYIYISLLPRNIGVLPKKLFRDNRFFRFFTENIGSNEKKINRKVSEHDTTMLFIQI